MWLALPLTLAFNAFGTPALRLAFPYYHLPPSCQEYFTARRPAEMIERAFEAQYNAVDPTRALARIFGLDPQLRNHWRLLRALPDMAWRFEGEEAHRGLVGRSRSPVGPMSARASCSLRHNSSLWVRFHFPNEPASRAFYERARSAYEELRAKTALGPRNTPTQVHSFDKRDGAVYIIFGNEYDDLGRSSLAELDTIAEFNEALAKALF